MGIRERSPTGEHAPVDGRQSVLVGMQISNFSSLRCAICADFKMNHTGSSLVTKPKSTSHLRSKSARLRRARAGEQGRALFNLRRAREGGQNLTGSEPMRRQHVCLRRLIGRSAPRVVELARNEESCVSEHEIKIF